jgi:hypothetical protein
MTCTHAALLRHRLVELNFKYDSLIMEESGQILEVTKLALSILSALTIKFLITYATLCTTSLLEALQSLRSELSRFLLLQVYRYESSLA